MNHANRIALGVAAAVLLVASCAVARARRDAVEVTRAAVADGVVDAGEVAAIQGALGDVDQAQDEGGWLAGVDWSQIAQIGLAVAGSLLGARVLPNRLILGRAAADKLA